MVPIRFCQLICMAVVLAIVPVSCRSFRNTVSTEKSSPLRSPLPTGQKWILTELSGAQAGKVDSVMPAVFLLLDSANRVYGSGGCNRFFGSYHIGQDSSLIFSDLGSTKMACEHLTTEDYFFKALNQTSRIAWDENTMLLLTKTGTVLARFSREIRE